MKQLWFILITFWLILLFALSPWDLELSRAMTNPNCWFGRFVNDWALTPSWLFVTASVGSLISARPLLPKKLSRLIIYQGLIQGILVTHSLKQCWGRVRPGDVPLCSSGYSPFYSPAGFGGGESFPSGHVATAMILAPLPFYLWQCGKKKEALFTLIPLSLYWLAISYGRVSFGVHYPTDTLFSVGFGILLASALTSTRRPDNDLPRQSPKVRPWLSLMSPIAWVASRRRCSALVKRV